MNIQFNISGNITESEEHRAKLNALITKELKRFSHHITRLEVHLSDVDGKKEGQDDKRCVLEARLQGRQPIAVTNRANNQQQAVKGATDKLKSSLDTILGRYRNH